MPIDFHAHYVSPSLMEEGRRDHPRLPIRVYQNEAGDELVQLGTRNPITVGPFGRGIWDLEIRIREMAEQGITKQMLSPAPVFCGYHLPVEECVALQDIHLDELEALGKQDPDRFEGVGMLPLQDVPTAIRRLETLVARGFRMFLIGSNVAGVDLDDERFLPFFEAVNETGVVLFVHPLSPRWSGLMPGYSLPIILGAPLECTLCFTRLVYAGIFDKFPDLRICWAYLGGYLPIVRGRIDSGWRERKECQGSAMPPSDYLRRCWYETTVLYGPAIRFACETLGAGRIVLGSDYPGDVIEHDPVELVRQAGLDALTVAAILDGNAKALLGDK